MEPKRKILSKDATSKGKKQKEEPVDANTNLDDTPVPDRGTTGPHLSGAIEDREDATKDDAASARKWSRLKKAVFFGVPALCLLVLVSGLMFFKFGSSGESASPARKIEPVTSIKRPIPLPDYKEMLDFLILYDVGGQKALTAFRMEFCFQSPNRYQNFKEDNVVFRDSVYTFLQTQNLPGNNLKNWQNIVEKGLLDYLKVRMPQSQADAIRLTQVENL